MEAGGGAGWAGLGSRPGEDARPADSEARHLGSGPRSCLCTAVSHSDPVFLGVRPCLAWGQIQGINWSASPSL